MSKLPGRVLIRDIYDRTGRLQLLEIKPESPVGAGALQQEDDHRRGGKCEHDDGGDEEGGLPFAAEENVHASTEENKIDACSNYIY